MKSKNQLSALLLLTFVCGVVSAQDESKRMVVEKTIKSQGADHVKAKIEMVVGSIDLSSENISQLLQAECVYYEEKWEPRFEYDVFEKIGKLHISNREGVSDHDYDEDDQSEWSLVINDNISTELNIYLGAGDATIDLEASKIRKLDYEMKAGSCDINLKNTSIPLLNINAIVGEATVDLSGKWENDLNAYIKGGVGDLTLNLPDNYSVELKISGVIGEVDTKGFRKEGKHYYRESKENSEILYLEVRGGIGDVEVKLIEQ
jgi:hypothetical protein